MSPQETEKIEVDADTRQGLVILSSTRGAERRVIGLTPDDTFTLCVALAEKAMLIDPGVAIRVRAQAQAMAALSANHNDAVAAAVRDRVRAKRVGPIGRR